MPLAKRSEATQPWSADAARAATDDTGSIPGSVLDFRAQGAALHHSGALSLLSQIEAALADTPPERAGARLHGIPVLADLLTNGPIHAIAVRYLSASARPVRAILFDKTPTTNWALGWHQDRTIVVRNRRDTPGYGPWTLKSGLQHVEPPFIIIDTMVTLRIHLDDVPEHNAPLLIAPRSHCLGKIAERDIAATIERLGTHACLATRGDVWAYATPILHASAASATSAHRRVLQVDYSASTLPDGLVWRGI